MSKLYMNSVISWCGLRFHRNPELFQFLKTLLRFINVQFLHQLIAAKHVSLYMRVLFDQVMIRFHLLEVGSIGVMNEVKAVASSGSVTKDSITFIIFKD
jgi:hypothetical protein